MKSIDRATKLLFYKIHKNIATGSDYLNWAYALLEAGLESNSLKMLASMDKSENIFVFEDYVSRTLQDLNISLPVFEDCARAYISELCLEITNYSRNSFDLVRDIFKVIVEIDRPLDLSIWIQLDDGIDRIFYDDEYYKPDEKELRKQIDNEAKKYLAIQEAEDFR